MDVIESRLSRAKEEAEGIESYDYLIVNDELEVCVDELHSVIQSEKKTVANSTELIARIRDELHKL